MITLSIKKSTVIGGSFLNSKVSVYLTLLECPENLRDDGKDSPTGCEHIYTCAKPLRDIKTTQVVTDV